MVTVNRSLRLIVYLIGLAVVLAGVFVLFTQTGLADWIPVGLVVAVILLILGIAVMAMSDRFGADAVVVDRGYAVAPPVAPVVPPRTSYVAEREVHYDDRPRDLL